MTRPNPSVGDTLYSLNVRNAARDRPQVLTPLIVTKVGRKYFTCAEKLNSYFETQFELGTWKQKTEYSPDQALYSSPQDWEDEKEGDQILNEIREAVSIWKRNNLSLEQLRKIKAIIDQ